MVLPGPDRARAPAHGGGVDEVDRADLVVLAPAAPVGALLDVALEQRQVLGGAAPFLRNRP
ncbi:hypothetical protein LUX57_30215 [Actinomadura madurae]|uniref:hypothetical protein n=1 Tax=Actinomadura madurae TaxID=1993 RepID=UPI0020D1FF0C|nr:hypothetical protein [Actinomadura madurae]MCP9968924.1 hypothetical protein [Actinomadura madurae]